MKTKDWLVHAQKKLEVSGIGTARLDTLVLLEDVTRIGRAHLLAEPAMEIQPEKLAKLEKLLNRRRQHEPLAYIRGRTEFYGRNFMITSAVLEPRPESETMIKLLKALPVLKRAGASGGISAEKSVKNSTSISIADVGAGSGALGITAALELPKTQVNLLEIDPAAVKIAKINVDKFTLNINVIKNDLLAQSAQDYDILLCNLPYIPDDYQINQAASHEPRLAIFGGTDGLDVYRRLFEQIAKLKNQPLYILTESLPPQHATLAQLAAQAGYKLKATDDFIQQFNLAS